MATATYNKFEAFTGTLGLNQPELNANTVKIYLTNATPSASADSIKTDLAEITAGNGYTAGGYDSTNTYSESGGVGTFGGTSFDITASGGAINTFRYLVMYNDTSTNDDLMAWWDYGSAVDLADGQTLAVTIGANLFTLT